MAVTHRVMPLAGMADDLARIIMEALRRAQRLADRLGERLAFLARQKRPDITGARDQEVADLAQQIRTRLHVEGAPGREGPPRCVHRFLDIVGRRLAVATDRFVEVGGVHRLERHAAVAPSTGNIILALHHNVSAITPAASRPSSWSWSSPRRRWSTARLFSPERGGAIR